MPRVRAAIYDGDTPPERRWQIRKWANLVLTNPDMLHIGILPRHDLWADVLHNLALRRRRRGARVSRRVRLACRERAAPAAPPGAGLRRRAAVPARFGDDRESRRARALAARRRGDGDRRRRRSARRAHDRPLESRADRRGARAACERARRRCAADVGARPPRPPHDLLREEPQAGGADPPHDRRPRRHRDGEAARAVPRGLYAGAAARHRAPPRRGRAARRRGDGRARARHRHRPARLRDLRRLPRDGCEPPPAVGPSRAARARARDSRRVGGRARPVLHARAGNAARAPGRGRDPRPREPARARRPRRGGRVRGAGRRRRPRDARRRGARARAARTRAPAHEARLGLGRQGLPGRPHAAPLRERRLVHDRRCDDGHGSRCRRARARVLDRSRRRRLPSPRRAVARQRARPRSDAAPSSCRTRATGTRR